MAGCRWYLPINRTRTRLHQSIKCCDKNIVFQTLFKEIKNESPL